jgi:hypothetical protein
VIVSFDYFGGTEDSHSPARRALYHLCHVPALFALAIFKIGSHVFARGWPQTELLLPVPLHLTTPSLFVEIGLIHFLPRLGLNCDPSNLYFPRSWDYRHAL